MLINFGCHSSISEDSIDTARLDLDGVVLNQTFPQSEANRLFEPIELNSKHRASRPGSFAGLIYIDPGSRACKISGRTLSFNLKSGRRVSLSVGEKSRDLLELLQGARYPLSLELENTHLFSVPDGWLMVEVEEEVTHPLFGWPWYTRRRRLISSMVLMTEAHQRLACHRGLETEDSAEGLR